MSHVEQIREEFEDNNNLSTLNTEVENIADDLFSILDNTSVTEENINTLKKIHTHIRKNKTKILQRDTEYQGILQDINDATTNITTFTGKAKKEEQIRLTKLKKEQSNLKRQYKMNTYPTIGTMALDVRTISTNLQAIEDDYKSLIQTYGRYRTSETKQKASSGSNTTIEGNREIFQGRPITGVTYSQKSNLSDITIKYGEEEIEHAKISGIAINTTSGEIMIPANAKITNHRGKNIPRDQDITIDYTIRGEAAITPSTLNGGTSISTHKDHAIKLTLQSDPDLAEKRKKKEEKEEEKKKKKEEKKNKREERKTEKGREKTREKNSESKINDQKNTTKKVISGTAHTLTTALTAQYTAPVEIAAATGKMAVQGIVSVGNHIIYGGIKDTIDEIKRSKIKPKSNREAALRGATLGLAPGAKIGRGLLKGAGKIGKRALETIKSVGGKGWSDVKTSLNRKKDYTLANKTGFLQRSKEFGNQLTSGWKPTTPGSLR